MLRIQQLKIPLGADEDSVKALAAKALRLNPKDILSLNLVKKAVDARDKGDVHFVLTLDVEARRKPTPLPKGVIEAPSAPILTHPKARKLPHRPLVVGMGPAGLFAALTLAEAGLEPIMIERGQSVEQRQKDVQDFWRTGKLNLESNVQFGEGGAGTFSDGKLNTGTKDARSHIVLQTFVRFGAPENILTDAKPHIGTDRLSSVVQNMRKEILRLGGEVHFQSALQDLYVESGRVRGAVMQSPEGAREIDTENIVLAIGHSARDTFLMLHRSGAAMEQKPFSIGARIEHRQADIDRAQYGVSAGHPALGAADYKLSDHLPNGRAVYTFCMCPGGQVVAAASEAGGVVVNGMSYNARDGINANSALLVSVGPGDFGSDDPLAGVRFQQTWERAAYQLAGASFRAPAQLVGDFLLGRPSSACGRVRPTYLPGVQYTDLAECLPDYAIESMRAAIPIFARRLRGFDDPEAVLTGVETRSSSPVRILRGERLEGSIRGLYPCGEGAGYAGGIRSAAVDGIRCAEALASPEDKF